MTGDRLAKSQLLKMIAEQSINFVNVMVVVVVQLAMNVATRAG